MFHFDAFTLMVRAMVLVTALPIHECAHAWAADKLGDPTARNMGRLTLNPISHLDLLGAVLMLFTGFGWAKPVPIYSRNFKNAKQGMALSALAGPVSNALLAFFCLILYKLWAFQLYPLTHVSYSVGYAIAQILYIMCLLNINLAVFNLIPIPPLDGSRLVTALLPTRIYYQIMQYERYIMLALFAVLFLGVLDVPLSFLTNGLLQFFNTITAFLGGA